MDKKIITINIEDDSLEIKTDGHDSVNEIILILAVVIQHLYLNNVKEKSSHGK